jgi:malate dehydrogenase (oxaloacetate-decarboxylating)
MDYNTEALRMHKIWKGKIKIDVSCPLKTRDDLSIAYTPGVAAPCLEIAKNRDLSYEYTRRGNLVAVITDGTAVLGLGDIGPESGMPVMEGKCALFKAFGDVDAFPICLRTKNVDDIVHTVEMIAGSFGGINLEDIAAPRCFQIEERLKQDLDIPVFHDDQHGTAIVVLASLINALKITGKKIGEIRAVLNGAGAAGTAVSNLLIEYGLKNLIMCDRKGALAVGEDWMTDAQAKMAKKTNPDNYHGDLAGALKGADLFLGFSAPGCVTSDMVASMAREPIIFACANPNPEIYPEDAKKGGARIVGTGRSDYNNQINNVLVFPGLFRGALDVRAKEINEEMKIAAAEAIASFVTDDQLCEEFIIPSALNRDVSMAVAKAVSECARKTGVARV